MELGMLVLLILGIYAIDRICECIETKYIAESENENGNTEDNQKER